MAPQRTTRSTQSLPTSSTARTRKHIVATPPRRAPAKIASRTAPIVSRASPDTPIEPLGDSDTQLVLPIRFQCPLCFDVLRLPIQLPCCQRHLCHACFERALEITSVNCGFCRKRIVGFARKKQDKVDANLWSQIRQCCPFVKTHDASGVSYECVVDVEFVDEHAPPKRTPIVEEAATATSTISGVREPEAMKPRTRHDTIGSSRDQAATSLSTTTTTTPARRGVATDQKTKMQWQLEAFFAGTLPSPPLTMNRLSSGGVIRSLRSTSTTTSSSGNAPSKRRRLEVVNKKRTALETTRCKSTTKTTLHRHSTTQRTLLQLTLQSPGGNSGNSSRTTTNDATRPPLKIATRPRRPWRCRHCTFENTCFDTRCSMCHQYPASAPALP